MPQRPSTPAPRSTRRRNRLNDLTPTEWIRFQKSWFVHNPPPREKDVLLHPAKFPEDLVQHFIEFFTKRGETVLDPMCGTASVLIACARSGRRGIGVELLRKYQEVAVERLKQECAACAPDSRPGPRRSRVTVFSGRGDPLGRPYQHLVIRGDARRLACYDLPEVHYCLTSPPYWDMLNRDGFETQRERKAKGLDVSYSRAGADLGNITDYEKFIEELAAVYFQVHDLLAPGRYLTVIVKNVKKGGRIYPLAWDLAGRLTEKYVLKDEKIWCQDNQRLAPYGMFSAWVSNTMHHYCLNFRKE